VLPGVRRLLESLDTRDDVFCALLTGNGEDGARIKLQHFDIWKFFRCGAYGDDVTDRNHLFDIAMERAYACGVPRIQPSDVVVVGDTVLDVACAKAAGARSVAVATGPSDIDTLRKSGADVVVRDLNDTEAFFRMLAVQI
jgi:phosphoglycolate phosphatase-like HAD superfamily hydrolase